MDGHLMISTDCLTYHCLIAGEEVHGSRDGCY